MPRDSSGNYTLPAGNPVVTNTIIESAWANSTMGDVATQLNGVVTRDGLLSPTGQIRFVNGTAAAPGISFSGAPTTGFYRLNNAIGISINGVEAATSTADGLFSKKLLGALNSTGGKGIAFQYYEPRDSGAVIFGPKWDWFFAVNETTPGVVINRDTSSVPSLYGVAGFNFYTKEANTTPLLEIEEDGGTIGKFHINGITDYLGHEIGFRDIVTRSATGTAFIADDRGSCVLAIANMNIPASVFNSGDVITVANLSATPRTITADAGLTLRLAGTTTTGSRTIGPWGLATILFPSTTTVFISGPGVT
jgi:hypothetical protein